MLKSMKTTDLLLGLLTISLLCPALAYAQDPRAPQTKSSTEKGFIDVQKDDGLTVKFLGEEDKGALRLFVKNAADQHALPTASDLNAIAPAAGIQFKLEF